MRIREESLLQLINETAYAIYRQCLYEPTFEKYSVKMTAYAEDPSFHAFVCSDGEDDLGIAVFRQISADTAEISGLAVAEAHQRRGTGRFLLRAAALSLNVSHLKAETDADAASFYEHEGFSVTRFTRDYPDGDAVRYDCVLDMDTLPGLEIRPSGREDLENIRSLWGDPDVMRYIGLPEGYTNTAAEAEEQLESFCGRRPLIDHYCIFFRGVYCGESSYHVHEQCGLAEVHAALFPFARGKGIASKTIRFMMEQALTNGAKKCYVTPNSANTAAIALYRRLGMVPKEMPKDLDDYMYPWSVYMETE